LLFNDVCNIITVGLIIPLILSDCHVLYTIGKMGKGRGLKWVDLDSASQKYSDTDYSLLSMLVIWSTE